MADNSLGTPLRTSAWHDQMTARMVELRKIGAVSKQVLRNVLSGTADANIRFGHLRSLLKTLGFSEHVKGSHHIFTKPEVVEILNLQPRGSLAKPYQVKQVRAVIVRYKLAGEVE